MSQWYLTPEGKERLKLETLQMNRHVPHFFLCHDDETGNLVWQGSLSVCGHHHGDVRLVYDELHPYLKMKVYVLQPQLPRNLHVHEDGEICYEKNEWSPEWTAYAVYLTTIRFLEDFHSGRMNDYIPTQAYVPRERSHIERILDGIFG